MNILKVYSAVLKDCEKEIILQPFISTDDENAIQTVRNAIREDNNITSLGIAERVKLYWICDIDPDTYTVCNTTDHLVKVKDEIYFRKYAQQIYAEKKKIEANEAEAEVMADPDTKEAFYHDICENTQIPSDEFMKGEIDDD